MGNLINSLAINLKKGLKSIEPVVMLFSGTYLLVHGIQSKNFPLGAAGGMLLFRGGIDLGKAIEESELKKELVNVIPETKKLP
jgi:hypothetical protein